MRVEGVLLLASKSLENFIQLIVVLLLFVFVLLITYLVTRWIGGIQAGQMSEKNIKMIETVRVTNNKYLQIIKIGEKYYLISVCKDTINLITEIKDQELKEPEYKNLPGLREYKDNFQKVYEETKKRFKK